MTSINYMAIEATRNHDTLNKLISENEFFILRCTSKVAHHYITKSDDEWSIGLLAFTQAVKSYELKKGSFLKFAELVIHRRIIDYYRKQTKYQSEVPVNPAVLDSVFEEEEDCSAVSLTIAQKVSQKDSDLLKHEVEAATEVFSHYGFSFMDLSECSPRSSKTRLSCAKATMYLLNTPLLIEELRVSKKLSLKIIEKNAKVPRKILERHRKYIIAAVEILSGEYPYLAAYMQYMKEEIEK